MAELVTKSDLNAALKTMALRLTLRLGGMVIAAIVVLALISR